MKAKSLSVIVANYNHSSLLPRSLDSILTQSRLPDEILICDDASSDNSLQVIGDFARKSPLVRLISNAQNKGVLSTIRLLADESRSDYVLGCAADDELCPGFIERAMASAEQHPDIGMHVGRMIFRTVDETMGQSHDREVAFGRSEVLGPEQFRKAPAFLDHCLQYGLSISSVYRKCAIIEAFILSRELGPQSDILERLFVASKYGVSILDVPGEIFYLTPGGYSRQGGRDFAVATAQRYLELCRMIRRHDLTQYFPEPLARKLIQAWTTESFNSLDGHVSGAYHKTTAGYYDIFKDLQLPGLGVGKFLAKLTGIGRELQRRWLRHCILDHVNRDMKQRLNQTSR